MFSHEYGWDTERMMQVTLFELNWRTEAINRRYGSQEEEEVTRSELTESQKKDVEAHLKKAKERVYGRKQKVSS